MSLSQCELKKIIHYEPETGVFIWKIKPSAKVYVGDCAGCLSKKYIVIRINRNIYKAHRLAWLYMTGEWPSEYIDHINGDCADNRFENLREATHFQNCWNSKISSLNKSGFKGVSWYGKKNKWRVFCAANGINKYLGMFDTALEGYIAYKEYAENMHKEFFYEKSRG